MNFAKGIRKSPVKQNFVWVGDLIDGTMISEYDFKSKKHNDFYKIEKEKLINFGLVGENAQVFFKVANGIFYVNGHSLQISYVNENKEYPLTGRAYLYNDIITYKDAVSDANPFLRGSGQFKSQIMQYNVGFKKNMFLVDANINFQCIASIPMNDSAFLQIKISSDKDLEGKLIIRRNNVVVSEILAPLKANHSGSINWKIK